MTAAEEEFVVEFGPLEQRGLLLGVSGPSLAVAAAGVAAGLAALFTVGGLTGLLGALTVMVLASGAAFLPVAGAPAAEWAALIGAYTTRLLTRRTSFRSHAPTGGTVAGRVGVDLPAPLRRNRTRIAAVPFGGSQAGVIIDGDLAIGVLKARAASAFLMKQPGDQVAATSAWADIIGSISDPGSPWVRLQWRDATAPVDSGALASFVADAMCPQARHPGTPEHAARTTYERLTRQAAPASESHQVLLCLALDPKRLARQVKDAGRGDPAIAAVVLRHLEQFAYKLAASDILVEGILTPRQLGQVLREQADPAERLWQSQLVAAGDTGMAGVDPAVGWPLAADEQFHLLRTDGAFHTTLWVAEWPRRRTRVDFLAPLLLRTGSVTRIVSVTLTPVDPGTALRQAESTATSDESDDALRQRWGIRTSGRRRREATAATRREDELLDGYDDVRFSGYVTVSAPTVALLEESVADVMAQARAARLRLVRLAGQQAEAFWYTAPLCRGVR